MGDQPAPIVPLLLGRGALGDAEVVFVDRNGPDVEHVDLDFVLSGSRPEEPLAISVDAHLDIRVPVAEPRSIGEWRIGDVESAVIERDGVSQVFVGRQWIDVKGADRHALDAFERI
jgi:hypothetical protein